MAGFSSRILIVIVLMCLISAISAFNVISVFDKEIAQVEKNLPSLPEKIEKQFQVFDKQAKDWQSGCNCQKATYTCGCCLHLEAAKIKLNNTGCVNVSYLPDQYGISLTFSLDGKVVFNETVSARNPPPLCFGVPYLKEEASLCIDIYNLDISKSAFSGCVKVEARLIHVLVHDYDLGCFKIPLRPGWQSSNQMPMAKWIEDLKILSGKRKQVLF